MLVPLLVILGILVVVVIIWFGMYNKLVQKRNRTTEAYSQIDTQLQRRGDLIPNLVNTVKGYASHEAQVFKDVAELRSAIDKATTTKDVDDAAKAEALYDKAMMELRATAEAYPQLQASSNFMQLQEELTSTENQVSFARQSYNRVVNEYNTFKQTVPFNIPAGVHGFKDAKLFEAEEHKKDVPTVEF